MQMAEPSRFGIKTHSKIMTALLATTYFGPVQWYQKLNRYGTVFIENHENFQKQTYRSRCVIATANGAQTLSVPVTPIETADGRTEAIVSDHGNWRHVHWNALKSAYGESPFFEYYADDIYPFFRDKWENLFDFNLAICRKMCELLDIEPDIRLTDKFLTQEEARQSGIDDFRQAINPKNPAPDTDFTPRQYYQVYAGRNGFLPNMSVLDLLFNMGNESVLWL